MTKDDSVRKEILEHAQALFQQFGMKKTTMDEIAASCGKGKSTLYHYFKSKEEVFDAVIRLEMVDLRRKVKDKVEEHKSMLEKIKVYLMEFYREVIHKANLYRIIDHEHILEAKARKLFLEMMEFEQSYIIRIMEDGYDSGEYNNVNRSEIPWIAEAFLAAFYGLVQYSIEKKGYFDEERIQKVVNLFVPKLFN